MPGLASVVIGYVGVFFGNLIKDAASRRREYPADAAAVQFTGHRSPVPPWLTGGGSNDAS